MPQTPTSLLTIIVNGEMVETAASTLADLLADHQLGQARVATALNGVFVPAARRQQEKLKAGDRVEIVSPRQGG